MRKQWVSWIAAVAILFAVAGCDAPWLPSWWPFRITPVIEDIVAGGASSTALDTRGNVYTWGTNDGALGRETGAESAFTPGRVSVSEVTAIGGGAGHMLVACSDGTVYGWGYNFDGQVGIGSTSDNVAEPTVVEFDGLTGTIVAFAGSDTHSLALDSQGGVWAWGDNASGQLGIGSTVDSAVPVRVSFGSAVTITDISAADDASAPPGYLSLALDSEGNVWAWGTNLHCQLGKPTEGSDPILGIDMSMTPIEVSLSFPVRSMAAGWRFVVVVDDDTGDVWAWGDGTMGALGEGLCGVDNTTHLPVQVKTAAAAFLTGVTKVVATRGGYQFTLALKEDGTVWGWGDNSSGQLGDGTTGIDYDCGVATPFRGRKYAVQATGITDVVDIDAGYYHSLALKTDGTVWAWGDNTDQVLGVDSTAVTVLSATKVEGF